MERRNLLPFSHRGKHAMTPRWPLRMFPSCLLLAFAAVPPAWGQAQVGSVQFVRERYTKDEQLVPMRDGVKLFTSIYLPKDQTKKHPILLMRTPYSVPPYGKDNYR